LASTINGNAGSDIISGGTAADILVGGTGADTMTGGNGNDIFTIADSDSGTAANTADIILDFTSGADKLKLGSNGDATANTGNYVEAGSAVANFLSALTAANTALNTLNTGTGSSPAYNTKAHLFSFQYDSTYGYLFKDTDSDGDADMVVLLSGIDNSEIAHGDIIA
jgi:Hemolysin-type calcium-binding repeat (2 copies).